MNEESTPTQDRLYWDGRGDLFDWLVRNDLHPRHTPKGYSVRCLNHYHDDHSNSAQIFTNDLWWTCYACGERHPLIKDLGSRLLRSLGQERSGYRNANYGTYTARYNWNDPYDYGDYSIKQYRKGVQVGHNYYDYWLTLEPPREAIKDIPAAFLASLGWRVLPSNNPLHLPPGIFIPAWNTDRTAIPFCQIRHADGFDRRFSFPSGEEPLAFGYESLSRAKKFLAFTEGNSDRATLELAGIPTIAIPSAASGAILRRMGEWATSNNRILVACSDNDKAGSKLLKSLDGVAPYIDARPQGYKDYNEMYQAEGMSAIERSIGWLKN